MLGGRGEREPDQRVGHCELIAATSCEPIVIALAPQEPVRFEATESHEDRTVARASGERDRIRIPLDEAPGASSVSGRDTAPNPHHSLVRLRPKLRAYATACAEEPSLRAGGAARRNPHVCLDLRPTRERPWKWAAQSDGPSNQSSLLASMLSSGATSSTCTSGSPPSMTTNTSLMK